MNIHQATEAEALAILQDPTVETPWGYRVESIDNPCNLFIVDTKVLLALNADKNQAVVHVAIRKQDRAGARESLQGILDMLKTQGIKKVITNAPDERVALVNMLKKLGFVKIKGYWVIKWA